ncbi:MAG: FAD-dependent oxidoreductase, partial [Bacillota bacterium]
MAEVRKNPAGSVLVVGGGIGGVQTALDLAESGYYVYLTEKSPSIGGVMAQLDKTFPTNDCAMCILGPKLVECSRHLNIENITYAELVDLEGEEGAFTARIRKKPRYIDPDKCTGCGECAEVCPVDALSEYDECLADRKAVYRPFPQALPNVFTIEKKREHRLCQLNCPAGCDAQGYIALIAQGKYAEALTLIKETVPLPGVMGRICVHPCEDNCRRNALDEAVSVAALKRFAADAAGDEDTDPPRQEPREERVAIVGSGPAGLACAYYLALAGYRPTIFEALPVAGGMLAVGIPEYRLPRDVLQGEIAAIEDVGVEIRTNSPIGEERTLDNLFGDGFSAAYIAVGAHRGRAMNIPGEDARGVMQGVDFLREVNLEEFSREQIAGRRVAVVGGGNVAMDAARTAVRLGAEEVRVLYRRSQREMPALPEEVSGAVEEGVRMDFLVNPVSITAPDGQVSGVTCVRMQLGAPDESGRRRPEPIPGSEFDLEVDAVIECIGQSVDLSWAAGSGVEHDGWTVDVNPLTLQTSREGVFAGGDAVTGPSIAVEAVAAGRRAAESIRRYLSGEDLEADREELPTADPALDDLPPGVPPASRLEVPELDPETRRCSFAEVVGGYDEERARAEAERCLDCAVCSECRECVKVCEADAIDHDQREEYLDLDVGAVVFCPGFDEFDPEDLYEYGYRRSPNVVTSIEFERILSASGPYGGHLMRPSDGKHPDRIAWIQCIGSRDEQVGCGYCSSVCCTYAVKEAQIAKEHSDEPLHTTIFFMDMRTYGKDFEAYYERGKSEHEIEFVRSRVHEVKEGPDGGLLLRYADESGEVVDAEYDMVVLSVGLRPPRDAEQLAGIAGVNLNRYGFCDTRDFEPVATAKPGVFISGAFSGPKDIPETVMQASAAAGEVSAALAAARNSATREKEYPEEMDVAGETVRIGVFVCHCGINIGGVVDVPAVKEYARTLPGVAYAA